MKQIPYHINLISYLKTITIMVHFLLNTFLPDYKDEKIFSIILRFLIKK